jgi:hypothetical protein
MTISHRIVEPSADSDALMAFVSEDGLRNRVTPPAQDSTPLPLLTCPDEESRPSVRDDPQHTSTPPATPTWRARYPSLVPFGCGVAAGVLGVWLLPVKSVPHAAMPVMAASRPAQPEPSSASIGPVTAPAQSPVNVSFVAVPIEPIGGSTSMTTSTREPARSGDSAPRPQTPAAAPPSAPRAASPTLARYRGSLAVNSVPAGARVFVNGLPAGATPLVLKGLPSGSRVVRVELDGYQNWSSAVNVVANQQVLTTAALHPSSTP